MGFTPNYAIQYPDPATKVANLAAELKAMGLSIEAALALAQLPPLNTLTPVLPNDFDNSGFAIRQRGNGPFTAVSTAANPSLGYTCDRWNIVANTNSRVTFIETPGRDTPFKMRLEALNATNSIKVVQAFEDMTVKKYRGKTRTFFVWVEGKSTSEAITITLEKSATANTSVTGFSTVVGSAVTVTPTVNGMWVPYTATIPTDAVGLRWAVSTNNLPNAGYIDVAMPGNVKGTVRTDYVPRFDGISGEQAEANRYYVRFDGLAEGERILGPAVWQDPTIVNVLVPLSVPMRAIPTITASAPAAFSILETAIAWRNSTAYAPDARTSRAMLQVSISLASSGASRGQSSQVAIRSGYYLDASAEL